jgi:DUF1365 family protein
LLAVALFAGPAQAGGWRDDLPQAHLQGSAGLRWFGLKIYDASLWSAATPFDPEQPFALELTYQRSLSRARIVQTSMDEIRRLFGFVFNPVSFWLCHDSSGALRAVLAEVNNTFGETHRYLLADGERKPITPDTRLVCAKAMHVSPFCEVRGSYRFRFRDTEKTTLIGIDYEDGAENCENSGVLIHTTVGGRLQAMTSAVALRALLTQPFLTFGIVAKIHWQAWKLWRKRVPFFRKPARPTDSAVATANFNKEMSP